MQKAYEEANTGDVSKILIDSPNNRLDPGKIDSSVSRKEPDLIIVSKDGKNITIYEVPSKTDYENKEMKNYKKSYEERLNNTVSVLKEKYGKDNVKSDFLKIDSSKFIDDNNDINKNYKTANIKKQYKNLYK